MSRRIYYWNPKRKQIQQEALLNLRAARASIGPELLDSARAAIADSMQKADEPAPAENRPGMVMVDRQKNLSVIMRYLEIKRDNQALLGKVKGLMTDS